MFHQSRKKIILSIMGSLILLFAVTMAVIVLASFRDVRHKNLEMLERYVQMYSLEQMIEREKQPELHGGEVSDLRETQNDKTESSQMNDLGPDVSHGPDFMEPPMDDRPDYQLSTFYSVAVSTDGSILAVDDGGRQFYEKEELVQIAKKILVSNKDSGRAGNLIYMISEREGYTLVAFMDNTLSEGGLRTLLRYVLIVGISSILVMFFVSFILSNRIIRPLEENDRKQKQFISDASHELKTPVAVIDANAEILSREIGQNEWLENIRYENNRMGEIVQQLLNLSHAENTTITMEQIDFSRVVTGETLAFENLAFEKGKMLVTDIQDKIILKGNQSLLTQLVSILLDNAVRHSTDSEIKISLKSRNHIAIFCVVNAGNEIPQDKLNHLFDRFYRLDEARNSEAQHYGIGLSIAKAVAEKHGGTIGVSAQNGQISFNVMLPIKK